jgi:hypothetical protein
MSQRVERSVMNKMHNDGGSQGDKIPVDQPPKHSLFSKTNTIRRCLVDLYWFEKLVIVIDFLQLYGLIWIAAQPWPW